MKGLSEKSQKLPASKIRKTFELVLQHDNLINFSVGEPDFNTPSNIIEVACQKLKEGQTRYTSSSGIPQLREEVAKWMNSKKKVSVNADQIVITTGAMQALYIIWAALLNPGDEVLVGAPFFANYESQIRGNGGEIVYVPLREENDFVMQPEDLEAMITPKSKALLLNTPSNPLGSVIDADTLRKIADVAIAHDLYVVTDEVYQDFIYDSTKEFVSIASIPGMAERTIIVDSFSKSYAMTGFRLGMLAAPKEIALLCTKLQESMAACVNGAFQYAGIEALTGPQEEKNAMIDVFRRRRDLLVDGMNSVPGFSCKSPEGAFYLFVNIKETGLTSAELSKMLIEKAGVAVVPGDGFSDYGEGYIRLSYVVSEDDIKEAIVKIRDCMTTYMTAR